MKKFDIILVASISIYILFFVIFCHTANHLTVTLADPVEVSEETCEPNQIDFEGDPIIIHVVTAKPTSTPDTVASDEPQNTPNSTPAITEANYTSEPAKVITTSSEAIRAVIRHYEGFTESPRWDVWAYSWGYGHTAADVPSTGTISKEEAIVLFNSDIIPIDRAVAVFAEKHNLTFTQEQFDALVCFVYNLGSNSLEQLENKDAQLISYLIAGNSINYEDDDLKDCLISSWTAYCNAGGKKLQGLVERRTGEVNLFLNGVYPKF